MLSMARVWCVYGECPVSLSWLTRSPGLDLHAILPETAKTQSSLCALKRTLPISGPLGYYFACYFDLNAG